ncbi:MAG: acetyltransferase [Pedosphaera sp.]|nr:acetyltransferase [Pedosphaera sp.]
MLKPIIFWGASGHAKVLREIAEHLEYKLVAVFDNDPATPAPFPDVPLFIGPEGFATWQSSFKGGTVCGIAAIGGARGKDRCDVQEFFRENEIEPVTISHPSAFISPRATLGAGSQVLPQSAVCVEARLGECCIVNTRASVDHECVLGKGVHIAPGASLAGCVTVGDFTLVAIGAVVLPRIRIGHNVIVGAGSVVTRDVPDNKVVFGNPARIRHDNPS